jgi:hypothetical protein
MSNRNSQKKSKSEIFWAKVSFKRAPEPLTVQIFMHNLAGCHFRWSVSLVSVNQRNIFMTTILSIPNGTMLLP